MMDPSEQPIESCTADDHDDKEPQWYNRSKQLSNAPDLTRYTSQSQARSNDDGLHHPSEPSTPSNPGTNNTENGHASPSIEPGNNWPNGGSQVPRSQAASPSQSARSLELHTEKVELQDNGSNGIRKLSSAKMYELTSSPESLPTKSPLGNPERHPTHASTRKSERPNIDAAQAYVLDEVLAPRAWARFEPYTSEKFDIPVTSNGHEAETLDSTVLNGHTRLSRPHLSSRMSSTPPLLERTSRQTPIDGPNKNARPTPTPLPVDKTGCSSQHHMEAVVPSPMPSTVPVPPNSLSTYLELELSSNPPRSLYIHQPKPNDYPYESSRIKLERLQNFLLLPPQLEQALWFGTLACLDAWLYSFTLLPLRFLKASSILVHSWGRNFAGEVRSIGTFIYTGSGRMWRRRRKSTITSPTAAPVSVNGDFPQKHVKNSKGPSFHFENGSPTHGQPSLSQNRRHSNTYRHHCRTRSIPSALRQNHKADILKGLLILISCTILMHFDASRMYHGIRGQAAIKLYVIYNVLEVCSPSVVAI